MLRLCFTTNARIGDYIDETGIVTFVGLYNYQFQTTSFYVYWQFSTHHHNLKGNVNESVVFMKSYPYNQINIKFLLNFKSYGIEIC